MKEKKPRGPFLAGVVIAVSSLIGEAIASPLAVIAVLSLIGFGVASSVIGEIISFIGVIVGTLTGSYIVSRRGIVPGKEVKAAVIAATIPAVIAVVMGGATAVIGSMSGNGGISFIGVLIRVGIRWAAIYIAAFAILKSRRKMNLEEGDLTR